MSHVDLLRILGCLGLTLVAFATIRGRQDGRLRGAAFGLQSLGVALWAVGLAVSFAGS